MFWRSKVFHPVWMPLEPQQWNYRIWDGPAEPIQEFLYTGIDCSSLERSSSSESVFYGSCVLAVGQGGSILLPAVPLHPSSSPVLTSPFCWVVVQLGQLPALQHSSAQDCGAGTGQQSQQGWGGHGASSDFMLELMTLVFSTAFLHPFVKAEKRMEGREQEGCVEFGVGTVFSSPSDRCCMQRWIFVCPAGGQDSPNHTWVLISFIPVEFEKAIIYRQF